MTDGPEPFAYSAEEWSAVEGPIPTDKTADVDLMVMVRHQLEEAASTYRAGGFRHRRRFPKGKPSPAIAWKRRRGLIDKALADVEPDSPAKASYVEHLRAADYIAGWHADSYDSLGWGHKGTRNQTRDWFYERVLDVWTRDLQGKLTTGSVRRNGRRDTTSPAIRFFEAAIKSVVEHPIGRDAIAKVVSAERERREKLAAAAR
jgi:hypothetical protein